VEHCAVDLKCARGRRLHASCCQTCRHCRHTVFASFSVVSPLSVGYCCLPSVPVPPMYSTISLLVLCISILVQRDSDQSRAACMLACLLLISAGRWRISESLMCSCYSYSMVLILICKQGQERPAGRGGSIGRRQAIDLSP
jgi:hypothetical protein